jgi:hypothetical protein
MTANKLFAAMASGANTAIYSSMDPIMIRALPIQHPEQLVIVNWRAARNAPVIPMYSTWWSG